MKLLPHVISNFGVPVVFLFHGAICGLAAIFVKVFVPETRGRTLTQLCAIYEQKEVKDKDKEDKTEPKNPDVETAWHPSPSQEREKVSPKTIEVGQNCNVVQRKISRQCI